MSTSITTAVIPVAGLGTRFLPATKVIPKELLTLVDKPLIQYVVEEAVAAGIKKIVFIDAPEKQGRIERHFSASPLLEKMLLDKGKTALHQALCSSTPKGVDFVTVLQNEPLGLGHAIARAKLVMRKRPFVVLLPDMIMTGDLGEDLRGMIANYEVSGRSQIMLEAKPDEELDQYGVADLAGSVLTAGGRQMIKTLVEKPNAESAPSRYTVSGRYLLTPAVFDFLADQKPGVSGEIQVTDALVNLCQTEGVEAWGAKNTVYDCGSKLGYLKATVHFARQHADLKEAFDDWLKRH